MKTIFGFLAILTLTSAASLKSAPSSMMNDEILRQTQDMSPEGNYEYMFETSGGIKAEAMGTVKMLGPEQAEMMSHGTFSWTSPEGEKIEMSYVADENGYQPQGSHLPVGPPIPDLILKSLQYIEAHPETKTSTTFKKH